MSRESHERPVARFLKLLVAGKDPSIEEFVALFPKEAESLAPLLRAMKRHFESVERNRDPELRRRNKRLRDTPKHN